MFPFVCMDYEGEQVSLLRRYDLVEREASMDSARIDFAVVCSHMLKNLMSLLNALMDEDSSPMWLQRVSAHALASILERFSAFLHTLGGAHTRQEGEYWLLRVLDYVELGAASSARPKHLLSWIPSVLVYAARLQPMTRMYSSNSKAGNRMCSSLLHSMVKCVMTQVSHVYI